MVDIVKYCLSKNGAYKDYPFGPEHMVMKVGPKMFAILSENRDKTSISLKCDPFVAETLRQQYPAVQPGYHLSKQHWNTLTLDGSIPDNEIEWMISHSYDLVYKSLTKSQKQQL